MILNQEQVFGLCKDPANGDCVARGRALQSDHKLHITGEGFERYLKQIPGYEDPEDKEVRDQLSQAATIDITKTIIDELGRWKSAQGTNKKYHLNKEKEKDFTEVLDRVWKESSMGDFITSFFDKALFSEFNGFMVVTKPAIDKEAGLMYKEDIAIPYDEGAVNPYLIFVSIADVVDYKCTGDKIEYLIWKVGEEKKGEAVIAEFYRCIDDRADRIIKIAENKKKITLESELPNEVGYVPAVQISIFKESLLKDEVKNSPIAHVLPMLNRYLSKDSFHTITEIKHAFPKLAAVSVDCPRCEGTGSVVNDDTGEQERCLSCSGKGNISPFKKGSFLALKDSVDEGRVFPPGFPAQYVTPDNESVQYGKDTLEELRQRILYAGTGNKALVQDEIARTATESVINHKSLEDRIGEIIDNIEFVETFLTDTIGKMHLDFRGSYEGCTIRYGRKMNLRDEDTVLNEIIESKKAGMPESHIESLQKELIASRYRNSPQAQERHLLLADIEPLCGYTIKESYDMREFIDGENLRLKVNFNERVDRFEKENGVITDYKPDMDHDVRVQEVRTKLLEYGKDSGVGVGQEPGGGGGQQDSD